MQYEELQAIWDTQGQRPVFVVNNFGLQMELYRTRERARQRLFWGGVFPLFACSPILLFFLSVPVLQFFFQAPAGQFPPDELPMTVWDVLVCLAAIVLVAHAAWSMHTNRSRHEKRQKVFAPSLRQEIELGIAQLDFEISMLTTGLTWRVVMAFNLAAIVLCWEMGRLNDHPVPWDAIWVSAPILMATLLIVRPRNRQAVEQGLKRKLALEALRAKLDGNAAAQ
jgi:hypothetical protein